MPKTIRLLTAILLIVLVLYAIAGLFVQPYADDLAFIALAKHGNPLVQQYYNWQGRYGYSFFMGIVMPIAPTLIVRIFPALLLILMVWLFYKLLKRVVTNPLLASSGLTLAFLVSLPDVWQSFYWYGSSTNYVFPLILAAGVLIWLLR